MPEYRTPLPQMFAASLEAAVNRVLSLDQAAAAGDRVLANAARNGLDGRVAFERVDAMDDLGRRVAAGERTLRGRSAIGIAVNRFVGHCVPHLSITHRRRELEDERLHWIGRAISTGEVRDHTEGDHDPVGRLCNRRHDVLPRVAVHGTDDRARLRCRPGRLRPDH